MSTIIFDSTSYIRKCHVQPIVHFAAQVKKGHLHTVAGMLGDYCDGEQFHLHPLLSSDSSALQIILYNDELELCNSLGSRRRKHKVGEHILKAIYYAMDTAYEAFPSVFCIYTLNPSLSSPFFLLCCMHGDGAKHQSIHYHSKCKATKIALHDSTLTLYRCILLHPWQCSTTTEIKDK